MIMVYVVAIEINQLELGLVFKGYANTKSVKPLIVEMATLTVEVRNVDFLAQTL